MPIKNKNYRKFDHDAYAKTQDPKDYWGQIRRTIRGKPVSDDQIIMIVDTILSALDLKPNDKLLDLACGNGALSYYLFDSCAEYLGIDMSKYLISIAKNNFESLPKYQFKQLGVAEYVRTEPRPENFSKVLCYGSFSYFTASDANYVLSTLFEKFANVQAMFIGNLPDKELAAEFYGEQPDSNELEDCCSQIGIWRTRNEFGQLATDAGWKVKFSTMPKGFYASHYRYDALLIR